MLRLSGTGELEHVNYEIKHSAEDPVRVVCVCVVIRGRFNQGRSLSPSSSLGHASLSRRTLYQRWSATDQGSAFALIRVMITIKWVYLLQ